MEKLRRSLRVVLSNYELCFGHSACYIHCRVIEEALFWGKRALSANQCGFQASCSMINASWKLKKLAALAIHSMPRMCRRMQRCQYISAVEYCSSMYHIVGVSTKYSLTSIVITCVYLYLPCTEVFGIVLHRH